MSEKDQELYRFLGHETHSYYYRHGTWRTNRSQLGLRREGPTLPSGRGSIEFEELPICHHRGSIATRGRKKVFSPRIFLTFNCFEN